MSCRDAARCAPSQLPVSCQLRSLHLAPVFPGARRISALMPVAFTPLSDMFRGAPTLYLLNSLQAVRRMFNFFSLLSLVSPQVRHLHTVRESIVFFQCLGHNERRSTHRQGYQQAAHLICTTQLCRHSRPMKHSHPQCTPKTTIDPPKRKRPNLLNHSTAAFHPRELGHPAARVPASTNAAPAKASGSSALVRSFPWCITALSLSVCSNNTQPRNSSPKTADERRAFQLATMLTPATVSTTPVKWAPKAPPGAHGGTGGNPPR
jgi:hypothetical protein